MKRIIAMFLAVVMLLTLAPQPASASELVNTTKALYAYNQAANAYFS